METSNKKWIKYETFFQLELNNVAIGQIEILSTHKFPKHSLNFNIKGIDYFITNTGSWESTFIIYNDKQKIILSSKHKNWSQKKFLITFENDFYELSFESAQKPTWHLTQKGRKIISYSIALNTTEIFIKEDLNSNTPLLFDFVMLYLITTG